MLDNAISLKIKHLRPMLIFLVVLIHAERAFRGYTAATAPDYTIVSYIICFFKDHFCRMAVPLFFAVSGYLFTISLPEVTDLQWYMGLIKKKFFRLVIPYLFFNSYLIITVFYFTEIPGISGRLEPGISLFFEKLIPMVSVPINFPLWFLRDLIVIFFCSPIVVIMLREIPYFSIVVLGSFWWFAEKYGYGISQSIFWFYLGCVISYKKPDVSFADRHYRLIFMLYVIFTAIISALNLTGYPIPNDRLVYNLNIFWGGVALWGLAGTKLIQNRFMGYFADSSFFIYLLHEPVLSLTQYYLCTRFIFSSAISQILLYFGSAAAVFLVLGVIGHYLHKLMRTQIGRRHENR